MAYVLPPGARLFGDKAYNAANDEATILTETGVRLIPIRKATMKPHAWFLDEEALADIIDRALRPQDALPGANSETR